MKCTNCGKINEEDTKFCIECGAPITHERQQQSPVSQEQTATDIARETDITEAKLEDFEDTGDVSTTATLPPLSPQSGETTPAKPQSQQATTPVIPPQQTYAPKPPSMPAPTTPASYAGQPQYQNTSMPIQPSPAPYNNGINQAASASNGQARRQRMPFFIIGGVIGALLLLCIAAVITYNMGIWGSQSSLSDTTTSSSPSSSKSSASSTASASKSTSQAATGFDTTGLNTIVDGFSTTDVSVAATIDGNASATSSENSYSSQQANKQFVAAGLYLPIYLQARAQNNAAALASASTMMQNMDNSAGNEAIASLGGLDAVTQWASAQGYTQTTFARNLGDVQASAAGYENKSSASDASRMLAAASTSGATAMMNYDLSSDGVSIPAGVTVHAHRGMGIQNTYNYFITMAKGSKSIALAVMTQSQGKDRTAQLTSALLSSMASSFDMK